MQKLNHVELGDYLLSKGVSQAGARSVRENGITGEMLIDFCEEDIKDAFTLFKDRFITRKLIRERKSSMKSSAPTSPAPRIVPVGSAVPQVSSLRHLQQQPMTSHFPTTDIADVKSVMQQFQQQYGSTSYGSHNYHRSTPPTQAYPGSTVNTSTSMARNAETQRGDRWIKTESQTFTPYQPKANTVLPIKSEVQATISIAKHTPPPVRSPLMHQTVSSTDGEIAELSKSQRVSTDSDESNIFSRNSSVGEKEIIDLSTRNDSLKNQPESSKAPSSDAVYQVMPVMGHSDPHLSATLHMVTLDEKLRVKKYTAEQLLCKKSIRGRPNEAQHLGTLAIRNAAQTARLWDTAPLIKDISREQKESFVKYILAFAPQLSDHMELVWIRLREALQNRRKYLSDKETGKRTLKRTPSICLVTDAVNHEGPSSPSRLKIEDVGSLIDLTD